MTLTEHHGEQRSETQHATSMWQPDETVAVFGSRGMVLIRIVFGLIALGLALLPFVIAEQLRTAEHRIDQQQKPTVTGQVPTSPAPPPARVEQAQR
jgi:hypothetical protein